MTTLFERLRLAGEKTCAYPLHEVWADVGTPSDLDKIFSVKEIRQNIITKYRLRSLW